MKALLSGSQVQSREDIVGRGCFFAHLPEDKSWVCGIGVDSIDFERREEAREREREREIVHIVNIVNNIY